MTETKSNRPNLIGKVLQPFWRLTRGQTMGAQGAVFDADNSILLIRHSYRPGWHFPGGGVEHHETILTAAGREILEETGIKINAEKTEFHGLFANFKAFPGDHVALFISRVWERKELPTPNAEIRDQGFFALDQLPDGTTPAVLRRLDEMSGATSRSEYW